MILGRYGYICFFLRLLLKLVLNIAYAVERCVVNGHMVNKNVRTFFGSLGNIQYIQEQRKLHIMRKKMRKFMNIILEIQSNYIKSITEQITFVHQTLSVFKNLISKNKN